MRRALGLLVLAGAAASAQVPLERTELAGAIAGRVCQDTNRDGRCGRDEPGIGGARLVLETGQIVLADEHGRYHFGVVPARTPDALAGGRLLPGRHRVRLDTRTLGSDEVSPRAATVEVPMAGLVVQDFAVQPPPRSQVELQPASEVAPPSGVVTAPGKAMRFLVVGRAAPGDEVRVEGERAEVDARGVYQAWVELRPGANEVRIAVQAPSGAVRFFTHRHDVVIRPEGFLVIPRPPRATAALQLPGGAERRAATGPARIRVESAPGTRIHHPAGEVVVGPDGVAEVPVQLRAGDNPVALRLEEPGQAPRQDAVVIPAAPMPLFTGLLDLEGTWNPQRGALRLFGRGGAHGEVRFGAWRLEGELELRDEDAALLTRDPAALLLPRSPERLQRVIDPERAPIAWADDAVELSPNAAEGRLRVELGHDALGRLGFGTYRAAFAEGEVGRFERMMFGPYLDVHGKAGAVGGGVKAFFAPGAVDPLRGLATAPAHDELSATGGSLYYLGHGGVSEGSERVRVEVRDGVTGLPLGERHLVRGRDYELDCVAGRLWLAQPLSFVTGVSVLRSHPLSGSPEQVLVVDYERLVLGAAAAQVAGGEARGTLGPVELTVAAVDNRGGSAGAHQLARATAMATAPFGSVRVEGAVSRGVATAAEDFAFSDDGGLAFFRPGPALGSAAGGGALTVRARGRGLSEQGFVDAAVRLRTAGFSDRSHHDLVDHRQLSLRGEQPLGPFVIGALVDWLSGQDPRTPFAAQAFASRRLGASIGYRAGAFEARLEADDAEVTALEAPGSATAATGGRLGAGAFARYRLLPALALTASHRQAFAVRGAGPGAFDDTFSAAGVELALPGIADVAARAGWGPQLGPLAWLEASHRSGDHSFFGSYSVDVDGPDFGERRAITGARTDVGDGTSVFVEDVSAHDTTSLRLSRAVGLSHSVGPSLQVTARFETGTRSPLAGTRSVLDRNAGGVGVSFVRDRLRLYARGELRQESGLLLRGADPLAAGGPTGPVSGTYVGTLQRIVQAAAELALLDPLRLALRFNYADTRGLARQEARLLEGTAALAWRFEAGMVVARYGLRRELLPADRGVFGERALQTVSLMPALRWGDRLSLSAGAHAGLSELDGNASLVLSGSLRPAVRVVGGLEIGAEVAARTAAPDGGELLALRGEAGYRFGDSMMFALGYTVFGFSGLGLSEGAADRMDRLYLRAELAY